MTPEQENVLAEGRKRISTMAAQLTAIMPALEVAKLFLGPAVHILRQTQGDSFAADFCSNIADEIRSDRVTLQ